MATFFVIYSVIKQKQKIKNSMKAPNSRKICQLINAFCKERMYKHCRARLIADLIVIDNVGQYMESAAYLANKVSGYLFESVNNDLAKLITHEVIYNNQKVSLPVVRKEIRTYEWAGKKEEIISVWVQPFDRPMIPGSSIKYDFVNKK